MDVMKAPVRVVRARPNSCPVCGPVAARATSRYCPKHLAELRVSWLAIRGGRAENLRPAA
jgi:hypothetical protein